VISLVDLTEGRRLHERLVHQALHDPLTGLPNRILFKERLEQALARPLRRRLSVVLVGLDRFRAVNDAHGHDAGDDLLMQVAARLQAELDDAQRSCASAATSSPSSPSSRQRRSRGTAGRYQPIVEADTRRLVAVEARPRSPAPASRPTGSRSRSPRRR
jgi:hypothetical protein